MRSAAVSSILAASTAAFVLPESPLTASKHHQGEAHSISDVASDVADSVATLWDRIYQTGDELSESAITSFDDSVDYLKTRIDSAVDIVDEFGQQMREDLSRAVHSQGGHDHEFPDHTIYDLIKGCKYTSKFAELVDEHEDVVKLLNSTDSGNITLFVPVNEAFDRIPDDHEKPGKDVIDAVLKYHVGVGEYRARAILGANTIPSAFKEKWLGDEPQRLRTGVSLSGINVNFYSKVIAADMGAKNGVIHGVRSILVPPPMIGRILTLFPSEFSTLLLAYEKTDFVKYVHGVKMVGSTVFAPSNKAFSYLGPKVNAFLFNTETGLQYLKALLKYHIVADITLYSDAVYDKTGGDDNAGSWDREHFDLVTLLDKTHVGVDLATFAGFTIIKVNGFANVVVRDAPGKNGVIHVLDKVLIPPRKHRDHDDESDDDDANTELGDWTVEELIERLDPYLEEKEPATYRPDELEL